ncbi:hypothetical protein RhiirA5_414142 [Rhizophagus irregularis]|uniref:Uncharacterized protein n=1 Tax=Rhizophagus irregularis TaxID=588596 RepID=A0A2I1ECD4_9GLOM|nr:hypothetical protein RhiirA5_414142 [Rhizophagus irregularis]PKY19788.1 hypothetical protein RhiirB3_432934 [Rhizophagus irregularis]CAB5387203.1 unnamed protein product [Rhizophagus irregularis]
MLINLQKCLPIKSIIFGSAYLSIIIITICECEQIDELLENLLNWDNDWKNYLNRRGVREVFIKEENFELEICDETTLDESGRVVDNMVILEKDLGSKKDKE